MRHIVLFLIVFLLLGGCSANDDWVHTFTGESDNWIVVMEIRPIESEHTTVAYPFYLTKKMENQVTKLYAEADLVNGGRASNLNQIDLEEINEKQQLLLFQEYPNLLSPDFPGKGTPKEQEQLEYYFSDLKMNLTWTDERGEHQEQIMLK
ncbi:hypothetical protein BBR47_50490 [Brevibacillus brevis NBRC 100599]|uniref:Lipoprotein n=1 Tax=Brevibacillus brevis (strain 47 / JCM 6285 / NBRC 100599) TaxID=358681 RepID=C0Z5C0_BREBN|nr:hypothetical protein [Brevibacillus brevis]BAH46026.1 hypothetical protein BBR47_50490 [Brevibacillus brevis NBRC 100599]